VQPTDLGQPGIAGAPFEVGLVGSAAADPPLRPAGTGDGVDADGVADLPDVDHGPRGYRRAVPPPPAARTRKPRSAAGRARLAHARLAVEYPDARCELDHRNAFELLVATILSAQSTDKRVNLVTPELFRRWPTPEALASADPEEVQEVVHSTGFFVSKTRSIIGMAARLVDHYGGEVPGAMSDLVSLPGVGRKTANVVRSVALGLPGLPVDTHVLRLTQRLGIRTEEDPVKVELELNPMIPSRERGDFSLRLILHGRRICVARSPRCDECALADFCPSSRV
jgi:endonuclease-3